MSVERNSAPLQTISACTGTSGPSVNNVRTFRQRAIENGYAVIRVRKHSKAPYAQKWQHGEAAEALSNVQPEAANTGLLLAGLRCIDIDVDDPQLILEIMSAARARLPQGALIRRRANSPRLAMLYRAAEGEPSKRIAEGPKGKVEILGLGQQVVVHGLHPSGAGIEWRGGKDPDMVPRDQLPAVSEKQITAFLDACEPLIGAVREVGVEDHRLGYLQGNHPPQPIDLAKLGLPGVVAAGIKLPRAAALFPLENDLAAGLESPNWFSALAPKEKSELVQSCLDVVDNRISDPRDVWLRVLFAVADAERLGCQDARQLALEWSRRGASWTSEQDFDTAWNSAKPGGISIGSLLAMARTAGLDLSRWRDPVLAQTHRGPILAQGAAAVPPPSTVSAGGRALCTTALPLNPPKRQWLHGTDIVRGAVSLLVAPGGRGKSSWLVTLSLACASNHPLLGAHVFGGPLRVLLVSAEDPTGELALRLRAAMKHHSLTDSDVAGLHVIGADRWGISLLSPGATGPMLNKAGWDDLTLELDRIEPDILIIDPLISVMGGASQNDNAAAAIFMGKLVSLAANRRIGVTVAHHAAKGRDPVSADSAMGAASFVNLSRIALAIEPLAPADAGNLGLPPWEARDVFRIVSTKHNFSPPAQGDRWFRIVSVDMLNAQPPIYPNGDKVGVVEVFQPGASGPRFSPAIVRDALLAVANASTPLSPSKRATGRHAVPAIAQAIAPHRGGRASDIEAGAVLDHLLRGGLLSVQKVKIPRPGGRSDDRDGLVLTPVGKHTLQGQTSAHTPSPQIQLPPSTPQPPQSPATAMRHHAGGAPLGPPQRPRGCGGNAGESAAGTNRTELPSNAPQRDRTTAPHREQITAADPVSPPDKRAADKPPMELPAIEPPLAAKLPRSAPAVRTSSNPSTQAQETSASAPDTLLRDPEDL